MSVAWAGLIAPLTSLFGKISDNRKAIKQRKIDRIVSAEDRIAEWELIQAENRSWLTPFYGVILAIPMVCAFIPSMVPTITDGFKVLEQMPEFYQYWLAAYILAQVGLRVKR